MAKRKERSKPHHGKWYRRVLKAEHAALLVVFTAALTLAIALAGWYYQLGHPPISGAAAESADKSGNYKNLDLSLARQAIYSNSPIIKEKSLSPIGGVSRAVIKFQVPKDGLSEYGLMTLPAGPVPAGGYPVIVLCHGYANPGTYSTATSYLSDMLYYSRNGFAVIKPDFRGQGLSLVSGQPEGAYYSMAYNTDTLSLLAAIKTTPYINSRHINVWGHSMGAYVALRAAVLDPDIKSVILLSGPVGTPQHMYGDYRATSDTNNTTALNIRRDKLARYGTPLSNPAYWNRVSPLNYLRDSGAYFQIHVGTADEVVPPVFSADLDQALNRLSKTHGYFVYPGGKHGLVPQRDTILHRSLSVLSR